MSDERMKNEKRLPERQDRSLEGFEARGGDRDQPSDDDVRVQMFRDTLARTSLPMLPPIPGYHVCWLTTSNPRDNIAQRTAIGYEPITEADMPNMKHLRVKDGEMAGYISINEMVAFKIRVELYQRYMMINHHDAPLEEEEKLESQIEQLQAMAAQVKGRIVAADGGSTQIRQMARRPSFLTQ